MSSTPTPITSSAMDGIHTVQNSATLATLTWLYGLYRLGLESAENTGNLIYRHIVEHVVTGFAASNGSLALKSAEATLTITAGMHLPAEAIGKVVTIGEGVLGYVAAHGEPVLINGDASQDPRFAKSNVPRQAARPRSAMCWPLSNQAGVFAVISINRGEELTPFSEEDLKLGRGLIDVIAVVLENVRLNREAHERFESLKVLNKKLEEAHNQLLQSEKLAGIGQLAAGVAHEINNPIGYVQSNLSSLQGYINNLIQLLDAYQNIDSVLDDVQRMEIDNIKNEVDVKYLEKDILDIIKESQEGVSRVRQIVKDLKNFSHVDEAEWQPADIHAGIDSTLNIVWNEIKYKADVKKEYGVLPLVECIPSQLNQVFMNLMVNAAQAIGQKGSIRISTACVGDEVCITVADSGKGIAPEHLQRIFEPFFTTKPVGKGTGLGLSVSYGIVTKHGGRIEVRSELGKGTEFDVWLPVSKTKRCEPEVEIK